MVCRLDFMAPGGISQSRQAPDSEDSQVLLPRLLGQTSKWSLLKPLLGSTHRRPPSEYCIIVWVVSAPDRGCDDREGIREGVVRFCVVKSTILLVSQRQHRYAEKDCVCGTAAWNTERSQEFGAKQCGTADTTAAENGLQIMPQALTLRLLIWSVFSPTAVVIFPRPLFPKKPPQETRARAATQTTGHQHRRGSPPLRQSPEPLKKDRRRRKFSLSAADRGKPVSCS